MAPNDAYMLKQMTQNWNERNYEVIYTIPDRLCGLVVRGPGYRSIGPGFDSPHYNIF
jgi:hypothetical protein